MHLQNILIKCEAPKQTSILRRQDSYWQKGGILTIWRDLHMQKRMMLDLLRCPGASSPSSGLSNLKTIRLPALMCNIKWIYNSFKWPVIPSLWKTPRHWHSLGASRLFSESCHFSSALTKSWDPMLVLEILASDDYEIPRKHCFGRITRPLRVSPRHKTRHKNACVLLRSKW